MRRNQLLAGIMTIMTVVMPVANVYADSAKDHEIQIAASIEKKNLISTKPQYCRIP